MWSFAILIGPWTDNTSFSFAFTDLNLIWILQVPQSVYPQKPLVTATSMELLVKWWMFSLVQDHLTCAHLQPCLWTPESDGSNPRCMVTGDFLLTGSFSKWAWWNPPLEVMKLKKLMKRTTAVGGCLLLTPIFTIKLGCTPKARSVSPYRLVQARPVSPLPPQVEPGMWRIYIVCDAIDVSPDATWF